MRPVTLAALALAFALPSAWGGDPKPKQDAKAEAVAKEWKRLEGTWELVTLRVDGKPKEMPEDERPKLWLPAGAPGLTYQLYPTRKPKAIDFIRAQAPGGGLTFRFIYELKGVELRMCGGPLNGPRPTEFTAEKGSGRTLVTYRRAKEKE
jgi:uncharacterized protein (TIGR03067 family)